MSIAHSHQDYIPAAGHHWSLPLYDPLTALLGVNRVRRTLVERADLGSATRVLDVGCGTGTLAVLITRAHPHLDVAGIDPDPAALALAARKAARAGVSIRFERGMAGTLPFPDGAFDRVFSSFMFHHLRGDEKTGMLREVQRVLAPGGRLELVDFAGPEAQRGVLRRLLHGNALLQDNAEARVLSRMREANFAAAHRHAQTSLLVGLVNYYRAERR
jgi:ubiquinone/menaquinone biosynthesis C-methylase UbiE